VPTPSDQRTRILESARALLAERPLAELSTADVAAAAGVPRSLVHDHFAGIGAIHHAIGLDVARRISRSNRIGPEVAVEERLAHNADAMLDVLAEEPEAWLAASEVTTAEEAGERVREETIERMLAIHADLVADTPATRAALGAFVSFSDEVCRRWLRGQIDRAQTHALLTATLLHLLRETIPAVSPPGGAPADR
jgi:AcrR family transcriptional regulator